MHVHKCAVLERARRADLRSCQAAGFFQQNVERLARCAQFGQRHRVSALDRVRVKVRQVQRRAGAGPADIHIAIVILHGANARRLTRRLDDDWLAAMQRPAGQCAGDDCANAA